MSISCHITNTNQFTVLSSNSRAIEIKCTDSIIDVFPGLALAVHCNPLAISTALVVGTLASTQPGIRSLCGTAFPIAVLEVLCSSAFSVENTTAFFQVCATLVPSLHVRAIPAPVESQREAIIQSALQKLRTTVNLKLH